MVGAGLGEVALALGAGTILMRPAVSFTEKEEDSGIRASVRIAVVQTNVPQSNKVGWPIEQRLKDFARFARLTRRAAEGSPDLIVWPETMFPGDALDPAAAKAVRDAGLVYRGGVPAGALYDAMLALQREVGTPIMVGAIGYDDLSISARATGEIEFHQHGKYNSVFLIEDGAVRETRYDKLHLTPFGEVMPYISWSDRLEKMLRSLGAPGMLFDLDAGSKPEVFHVELDSLTLTIATPICFESATPGVCRRLVFDHSLRRASVIVNLTNDGWFGDSVGGREQSLQIARWRTIDLRTPMVRAANTGISAVIDAAGRVQRVGPDDIPDHGAIRRRESVNTDGVMRAVVFPSNTPATLYARTGDLVGWLCLLAVSGRLLLGLFVRLRRKPRIGTTPTSTLSGGH